MQQADDSNYLFLLYDYSLHFFNVNSNLAYKNGKLIMINYDNLKPNDELFFAPFKNTVRGPILTN